MPSLFQPFDSGSAAQSASHLHTPEATPLRKRENDSFASPEAPLLWRHPLQPATGGLHHASYSTSSLGAHYGELNFNHTNRRRGRFDNRNGAQFWIPWVMKAILASPVVVLLIWTVAVALRHPTHSSMNSSNKYSSSRGRPRTLQQQQQQPQQQSMSMLSAAAQRLPHLHKNPAHQDGKLLPVYVPMGSTANAEGVPALMNGYSQPQQQQVEQNNYMMQQQNQPLKLTQDGFQQVQPPPQMMMQQQQPLLQNTMVGQNMMQLPQLQPGQMYQQPLQQQPGQMYQQPQQMMQMAYQQAQPQAMQAQQESQARQDSYSQPSWAQMQMEEPQMQDAEPQRQMMQLQQREQQEPALTSSRGRQNQKPAHPNNLRGGGKKAMAAKQQGVEEQQQQQLKVYYYDPAQAVHQGLLQPPRVVYDEHGNEIELASLNSFNTDIFLEPPSAAQRRMATPYYGSTLNSNNGNPRRLASSSDSSSNTTPPILPPPKLEMSLKTPESWGTSTSQDQSIIVCTVAVMALLVGALSARRLRARSFLSSCIENERLEDEVTFDNAYTISGGDSYNTFGWKGDLEKFDV